MITAQIATIPDRAHLLVKTINSLINQVDQINVMLNGYKYVPDICLQPKINAVKLNGKRGDAAKFYNVEYLKGYILSCDDDLIYPVDYADKMIKKVIEYNLTSVISAHGRIMKQRPINSYYKDRIKGLRCLGNVPFDTEVDVAGTGCMAFFSDAVKIKYSHFKAPNMADIWMAKYCYRNNIKQITIEHSEKWIIYQHPYNTIFDTHFNDDGLQTKIYNSF